MIVVLAAALFAGCSGRRSGAAAKEAETAQQSAEETIKPFPFVAGVPSYISGPEGPLVYLVEHFWDKFDFADTTYVATLEEGWVELIGILINRPSISDRAIKDLYSRTRPYPAMYDEFCELADKYLYDPNSPLRNDEFYISFLEALLADPGVDELMKIAPRERLKMALKNRVGHPATDFAFTTANGGTGTLYGIKADYTILFFYNLGCSACKTLRETLVHIFSEDELFAELVRSGRLKVLALYPDADMTEWEKYRGEIPPDWINAFDGKQAIRSGELYDLKAIPSVYLLDSEKKVILKDTDYPEAIYNAVARREITR